MQARGSPEGRLPSHLTAAGPEAPGGSGLHRAAPRGFWSHRRREGTGEADPRSQLRLPGCSGAPAPLRDGQAREETPAASTAGAAPREPPGGHAPRAHQEHPGRAPALLLTGHAV